MIRFVYIALILLVTLGVAFAPPSLVPGLMPLWQEADTAVLTLSWGPAPRAPRSPAPTGYDWELWYGIDSTMVANFTGNVTSGATEQNERSAQAVIPWPCLVAPTFVRGRVRGTNPRWSGPGEWGVTSVIALPCSDVPAGAPPVQLDTLAVPPDTTLLTFNGQDVDEFRFTAFGDSALVCGVAYIGGRRYALAKPGTAIGVRGSAVSAAEVAGDWQCVTLISEELGTAYVDLLVD